MPRERRADGDLRRFQVANLTHHDHVGVLAQDVAQAHRERQPDLRPHGDLIDALEFVFHRLFNRDDALLIELIVLNIA
jgi:hypothetical protein